MNHIGCGVADHIGRDDRKNVGANLEVDRKTPVGSGRTAGGTVIGNGAVYLHRSNPASCMSRIRRGAAQCDRGVSYFLEIAGAGNDQVGWRSITAGGAT